MQENTELKHKLMESEKLKRELHYKISSTANDELMEAARLRGQCESRRAVSRRAAGDHRKARPAGCGVSFFRTSLEKINAIVE